MNKGKLVLIPVSSPVEGMKIYISFRGRREGRNGDFATINHVDKNGNAYLDYLTGPNKNGVMAPSELKQIAVEYDYLEFFGPSYDTILLHPDDYEKALPLIGQEVNWEQETYRTTEEEDEGPSGHWVHIQVAKLVTPKPVVYTKEQVLDLLHHEIRSALRCSEEYMEQFYSRHTLEHELDWWDKHKKK